MISISKQLRYSVQIYLQFFVFLSISGVLPFRPIMIATQVFLQELIVNPDRLNHLVDEAKMAALQHGLVMRTHETPNSSEVKATTEETF